VAATIITIIAVVALVPVSIFVAGLLHLLRRRPHPPGSFTREQWKEGMERGDVDWQRDLLTRSNHQSVGLTPGQFLGLLREVQQTVKEEPALSAYWDRRHQLERVLKQERQG
jgi:hypothetical protein